MFPSKPLILRPGCILVGGNASSGSRKRPFNGVEPAVPKALGKRKRKLLSVVDARQHVIIILTSRRNGVSFRQYFDILPCRMKKVSLSAVSLLTTGASS